MIRPILFNTEMVTAIMRQAYPKTVTRRMIKGFIPDDAVWGYTAFTPKGYISCRGTFADGYGEKFFKLPCQPEDILYVRETWAFMNCINCDGEYRRPENTPPCYDTQAVEYDDGYSISEGCFIYRAGCRTPERITWSPSIHMPKKAARIFLKIKDVRVERLQNMWASDVPKEGIYFTKPHTADEMIAKFTELWDSTIPKKKLKLYGWDANPWVWVIEFERCEKPEGGVYDLFKVWKKAE